MQDLMRKIEKAEYELIDHINKGGFDMQTFKYITAYNELCKFKENISKNPHGGMNNPKPY